ncbi:hypothetical protein 031MP004_88 [Bacillus phage 031MP004]|nr:hypothetical protein 031MP003_90 [Bacillus phage 031MP003]QFG05665.1 hypothetical protein 031MP004_88 [Bacillus phage 031MP004]
MVVKAMPMYCRIKRNWCLHNAECINCEREAALERLAEDLAAHICKEYTVADDDMKDTIMRYLRGEEDAEQRTVRGNGEKV